MTMRMPIAAALALGAAMLAPVSLQAASQPGGEVCNQDLQQVTEYLKQNQSKLTQEQLHSAQQQLEVAQSQCMTEPQNGQMTLSQLRSSIGMETHQSAEMPSGAESR